jgi:hypothetical protein
MDIQEWHWLKELTTDISLVRVCFLVVVSVSLINLDVFFMILGSRREEIGESITLATAL